MFDPITALSVAAAVVQFVDFSAKVLVKAQKIYKTADGATSEAADLQRMLSELQRLGLQACSFVDAANPATAIPGHGTDGVAVLRVAQELAQDCTRLSNDITAVLDDIQISTDPGWLESLRVARRVERRKARLAELQRQMLSVRGRIHTELLSAFADRQSTFGQSLHQLEHQHVTVKGSYVRLHDELRSLHKQVRISLTQQTEDVSKLLDGYIQEAKRVIANTRLLSSLNFEQMQARKDAIPETHTGTFNWIFESPQWTEEHKGVRVWFADWLRESDGIFWISGKAGSGKSTLIKYLSENKNTIKALEQWAGTRRLVVASHFFWSSGNEMQNSQIGLLRTICYDILQACPELIPSVSSRFDHALEDRKYSWTFRDLSSMLDVIGKSSQTASHTPIAFCFFVDGLDEYRGEHGDIIALLKSLASCDHIKICVSSRPWNIFEDAFGAVDKRKLQLQDLTREDITKYVDDKLVGDQRFLDLASTREEADEIIVEIRDKAAGVFLWVFLVVRELLKSVINGDSVTDLRRRLRSLPQDLERYFQHIFDNLDPFYKRQTARAFLMCLNADYPIPALGYCMIDRDDSLTRRLLSDKTLSQRDIDKNQGLLAKRINARAKDLLGIRNDDQVVYRHVLYVEFLHRTVRDFLMTQDILTWLLSAAGDEFQLADTLCWAQWIVLKHLVPDQDQFGGAFHKLALHARKFEEQNDKPATDVLNRLERYCSQSSFIVSTKRLKDSFWPLMLQYGFNGYIRQQFASRLFPRAKLLTDFWKALVWEDLQGKARPDILDPDLIRLLLDNGATPKKDEIWHPWLQYMTSRSASLEVDEELRDRTLRVTELFLLRGAEHTDLCRETLQKVYGGEETERLLSLPAQAIINQELPALLDTAGSPPSSKDLQPSNVRSDGGELIGTSSRPSKMRMFPLATLFFWRQQA